MESTAFLQVNERPFELRMKDESDFGFADFSCDVDLNNDHAAQELFLRLQLLRDENLKRYSGDSREETQDQQMRTPGTAPVLHPRYGKESSLGNRLGSEETCNMSCMREPLKSLTTETTSSPVATKSTRKSGKEKSWKKNGSFCAPLSPVALRPPSAHAGTYNPYCPGGSPNKDASPVKHACSPIEKYNPYSAGGSPNKGASPVKHACSSAGLADHASECLGIEQPNYQYNNNDDSTLPCLPFIFSGINMPRPLYGDDWGEPPNMEDYLYPEILSVIEEVDYEDDYNETHGQAEEEYDDSVGLCDCDLYISQDEIRIVKNDRSIFRDASNYATCSHVPDGVCAEQLKPLSPSSTADETESSQEDESDDEEYQEETCFFFLNGCLSLFAKRLLNQNRSCIRTA